MTGCPQRRLKQIAVVRLEEVLGAASSISTAASCAHPPNMSSAAANVGATSTFEAAMVAPTATPNGAQLVRERKHGADARVEPVAPRGRGEDGAHVARPVVRAGVAHCRSAGIARGSTRRPTNRERRRNPGAR